MYPVMTRFFVNTESATDIKNAARFLSRVLPADKEIMYFCIGSMSKLADSPGPLIGSYLKKHGYQVLGTIDDPVNALNMEEKIELIDRKSFVIALDASMSQPESSVPPGFIVFDNKGIYPGSALNQQLPLVGDIGIHLVVSRGTNDAKTNVSLLKSVEADMVMRLVKALVDIIINTKIETVRQSSYNTDPV